MNFLEQNSLYIVLIVSLMIWLGIFLYIFFIDRKISKIEKIDLFQNKIVQENSKE